MSTFQYPFNTPQPTLKERLLIFLKDKSALNRLILANIIVFLIYWLICVGLKIAAFLMAGNIDKVADAEIIRFMACPAAFHNAIRQPWSYITFLFFHINLWHIFFNLIMLWVAGKLFLRNMTGKQLVATFLIGGVIGNIIYQGAYSLFPVFAGTIESARVLGASGAIMAVFAAAALYQPNEKLRLLLVGEFRIIWLFVIFIFLDLLSIPNGNAGGHIAHLGGALYGAVSILFFKKWSFPHFNRKKASKKKKKEKFYTSQQAQKFTDEEYNAMKNANERKIDNILDKISKFGYDALTKEEKDFLFYESKRKQ